VTHDIEEAVAMAERVLIMAANPGRIVGEVRMDLPFPRNRTAPEFSRQREHLMDRFEQLVGGGAQADSESRSEQSAVQNRAAA